MDRVTSISIAEFKGFDRKTPPTRLQPGVFRTLDNVICRKSSIERVFGYSKFGTGLSGAVQLIDEFFTKTDTTYLICVTTDALYLWDSVGEQWVSKGTFSGSLDHPVSGDTWATDDWYLFTSSSYYPKKFDGSTVADLTTYIQSAQAIAVWDNRVWLGNIVDSSGIAQPQRLMWSSMGDATEFDPSAAGSDAGDLYLLDTPGWVQAIVPIGQYLLIYKDRAVYLIKPTDIGYEAYTLVKDIGMMAPGAIINMGTSHIFLGADDVYSIDMGGSIQSLGEQIKNWILGPAGIINRDYALRSFGFYVEELEECWFFIPVGDAQVPNFVLRYNPFEDTWATRSFSIEFSNYGFTSSQTAVTWSSATGTWSDWQRPWLQQKAQTILSTLVGDKNGQVYSMTADIFDDDGTAITGEVETGDFYAFDRGIRLRRVDVVYTGGPSTLQYSTDGGSSWTMLKEFDATSEEKEDRLLCNVWGKMFRFKITSDHYFKITVIQLDFTLEGWQMVV